MKSIILALLLISTSFSLHAADNAKLIKAQELVDIMGMNSVVSSMYGQLDAMLQNMVKELKIQESEQEVFTYYYNQMTGALKKEVNWQRIKPLVAKIYDGKFTEAEIDGLLAFYKSPTGKAFQKKMPVVMDDSMKISRTLSQKAMPKIQEIAKELSDELKKTRAKK